jgi:hypothetical protein
MQVSFHFLPGCNSSGHDANQTPTYFPAFSAVSQAATSETAAIVSRQRQAKPFVIIAVAFARKPSDGNRRL